MISGFLFALSTAAIQELACGGPTNDPRVFVSSLESSNVAQLDQIANRLPQRANCERGWVDLRRFELTSDRAAAQRALALLLRASSHRRPAWAFYALGRLIMRGPWLNADQRLVFVEAKGRAQFALNEAWKREPGLYEAGIALGQVVIAGQDRGEIADVRGRLRKYRGTPLLAAATPMIFELGTWLLDAEGMLEDADHAMPAGADVGLVHRARAIALAQKNEPQSGMHYDSAIAQASAATLQTLFGDLRVIAVKDDTAAFNRADAEGKRAWLRSFWSERGAATGQSAGERVAEHYRRLLTGRERFAVPFRTGRAAPEMAAVIHEVIAVKDFDDRGIIWLRHGEPGRLIRSNSVHLKRNESWIYEPPREGAKSFIFAMLETTAGYKLIDDIGVLVDWRDYDIRVSGSIDIAHLPVSKLMQLSRTTAFGELEHWLQDNIEVDSRFGLLATRVSSMQRKALARDWGEAQADLRSFHLSAIAIASERRPGQLAAAFGDSQVPAFAGDLDFTFDSYAFRGRDGRTEVTVALGLPASALLDSAGRALRFKASVQWGSTAASAVRADTVYDIPLNRPLLPSAVIGTSLRTQVIPGDSVLYWLTVQRSDAAAGKQLQGARVIPDYSGPGLALSDIVLAQANQAGTWRRGGTRLAIVPSATFPSNLPFAVYYEIYNVFANESYRTEIAITRLDPIVQRLLRGRKTEVTLRFDSPAAIDPETRAVAELRTVATELAPGRYRLVVTVTRGSTNESASTARTLTIGEGR